MIDTKGQVEEIAFLNEEIGYLKFFKYMRDYTDTLENEVIFIDELFDLMYEYRQENYPKKAE